MMTSLRRAEETNNVPTEAGSAATRPSEEHFLPGLHIDRLASIASVRAFVPEPCF
jgi:hypothetical protein